MELSDFLTLIQLAAGLNIAFVAVEVSQGYTRILSGKVFNIDQLLHTAFQEIKSTISVNRTTLDCTSSTDVNGKSTTNKIEEVKREYEKLEKKIEEVRTQIMNNSDLKSNFKSFSGLSLMMFLFCCTILFLAPFKSLGLVFMITSFILLYSICGWFFDESRIFCNLKWVIREFVVGLVLSVIVITWLFFQHGAYFDDFITNIKDITIIIAALLPFVNFIAFFLKMIGRVHNIQEQINQQKESLLQEIAPINEKFDKLRSLEELKMELGK